MKPITTPFTSGVFKLPGGTEENDLPVEKTTDHDGAPCIRTTWEPTEAERKALAEGANIYLIVWGTGTPPVAVGVEGEEPE